MLRPRRYGYPQNADPNFQFNVQAVPPRSRPCCHSRGSVDSTAGGVEDFPSSFTDVP